jgi:hypothetical protein
MPLERSRKPYKPQKRALSRGACFRLEQASVEALIKGERHIVVIRNASRKARMPVGFPKGIILEKRENLIWVQYQAKLVLTWLNENGHTHITTAMIRANKISMTMKIENQLNFSLREFDTFLVDELKEENE